MKIFKDPTHLKYSFIAFFIGLLPMSYFILFGIFADWERISDPVAHGIHFGILIPSSIFLFFISVLCGWFYYLQNYRKPITYTLITLIILSFIGSLCMVLSGAINLIEIFNYSFALFVVFSPILLLISIFVVFFKLRFASHSQRNF